MPSRTYLARRPGPFAALVQAPEIGGLRLTPLPPVRVRDRFYDTADGVLLQQGLVLRVREQDGALTAALRRLDPEPGDAPLPDDVTIELSTAGRFALPRGAFARYVRAATEGAALERLLALRQYRTPRVVHVDDTPVGLLSFDVVVYEVPGAEVVSNELEVKPLHASHTDFLNRLDSTFRAQRLVPAPETKFERGVRRLPRTLDEPALVLPDERRLLEAAVESGSPLLERRARVVLLDARGFRPDTIARETGLSMARVRHWRMRFREVRTSILDPDPNTVLGRASAPAPRAAPAPPAVPAQSVTPAAAPPVRTAAAPRPVASPSVPPPPARRPMPERSRVIPPPPVLEPAGRAPSEGDGLSALQGAPDDLAGLLEMFSHHETSTPLLDGPPLDGPPIDPPSYDDEDEGPDADAPEPDDPVRGLADALAAVQALMAEPPRPVITSEVATGPFAAHRVTSTGTEYEEPRATPLSRPELTAATPLVHAAEETIAYAVAAFETTRNRFVETRTTASMSRLVVAAHRVRLAVQLFRDVLPTALADRLVASLRPLVGHLAHALDYERAAEASPVSREVLTRQQHRALAEALALLDADRQRAWGEQARRLVGRLAELRAAGEDRPDDAAAPLDDYVGHPGEAPAQTRIGHRLGSLLWDRYERIRAFEDVLDAAPSVEVAGHLVAAIGGLQFVLELAAQVSSGPAGDVSEVLDQVARDVARFRDDRRTATLLYDAAALPPSTAVTDGLRASWADVQGEEVRTALSAVVSGI